MRRRSFLLSLVLSLLFTSLALAQVTVISVGTQGPPGPNLAGVTCLLGGNCTFTLPILTSAVPVTITSSLGSELAPSLGPANWTCGVGWDCSVPGVLNKNAGGVETAVPNPPLTIVPGTTYKVVVTVGALTVPEGLQLELGLDLAQYRINSIGTHTFWITARTTDNLYLTPLPAAGTTRFTITAVSVKPLVDGTGDLEVQGTLRVRTGARNFVVNGSSTDPTGYLMRVNMTDASLPRSPLRLRTDGAMLAWDYLYVWPNSVETFGDLQDSMLASFSDLSASGTVLKIMNNVYNHSLAKFYSFTSYNPVWGPSGTIRFSFEDSGLLAFGPAVVGSPALKASGTTLQTRLGDNSALAAHQADKFLATNGLSILLGSTYPTATGSVGIGFEAGNPASTTGTNNTSIGYQAGRLLTSNGGNTSVGSLALYNGTTASSNSALGYGALYTNVSGASNTAAGVLALYSTTASYNTAMGENAAYKSGATPATANAVTTGTRLTFLGYQAGLASATQRTNSTAIGNEAYVDADNTVALGDENVTTVLAGSASQATVQTTKVLLLPLALAALGTPANGTIAYCSDCAPQSNPCTGTSTGALAVRLNGAWDCR